MNTVEIYVSNITIDEQMTRTNTDSSQFVIHHLVADKDCYGQREIQTHIYLMDEEYNSVMQNGYYLG